MRAYITLLLLFCFINSNSQNKNSLTGRVKENTESKTDYSGITLSLLRVKDSSLVRLATASADGNYLFENIPAGKYFVAATAVGYKKTFSSPVSIADGNAVTEVNIITLEPSTKTLAGVTIQSQKPLIEHKADRMIVNVDASINNTGSSALDILERSPGVTVDKEGVISLKGKSGVQIFVDGRPTQMNGPELLNYLRTMNASQMDQLEIMTNPPARYDASGTAGIINIKTKKTRVAGLNGSANLSYGQGRYPKISDGFNFNYRVNKINVFTSLNHGYRKNFEVLTIQRRIRNETTGLTENYFDQQADEISKSSSYNGKLGMDYFADKKTSLGFVLSGAYSNSSNTKENSTLISDDAKELRNITLATVDNQSKWKNFNSVFYLRRSLDSTGREISTDLDYGRYTSGYDQFMINSYFDADKNSIAESDSLMGDLPQDITIYSGRMDYIHPLKNGAKFEAGIKSSFVNTDNDAGYDSIINGNRVHDAGRSNHFLYRENINAAYVNWNGNLGKKIQAQIGLRLENTLSNGRQLTTGESFERNYTQLFPTAYFQYKISNQHSIGLNYGRRIRRPNYSSLNPFIRFIDRYTYSKGNPDLRPQFGNNIELTHSYKNILVTTLSYSINTDIFQSVIEQKGQEAYSTQANIATQHQYAISISANNKINSWWTSNIYLNGFYSRYNGMVNNEAINMSGPRFTMSGSQQFRLSKTLSTELSANYRSGGVQGVLRTHSMWQMTAGVSKQVLKNNGTVRLVFRDMFYSIINRATVLYGNVDANFQERQDSRVLTLGFTYRFSKGKNVAQKKRTVGSSTEEQGRVGMD
jgi:iron complex outermembrane recepter protein